MSKEKLYDVVIIDLETGMVESIAGKQLKYDTGFHNAEKRLGTVAARLNDNFAADIVDSGKYGKGDVVKGWEPKK